MGAILKKKTEEVEESPLKKGHDSSPPGVRADVFQNGQPCLRTKGVERSRGGGGSNSRGTAGDA